MGILRIRTPYLRGVAAALAVFAAPAVGQGGWSKQAPLPSGDMLYAVWPLSPLSVWTTGQGGIVAHTSNGGKSWDVKQLDTNSLAAIVFLDEQRGWAAGNGIFHTTNGGQTWTKDSPWGSVQDLFFLDAQRGWGAGNGGIAYRTTNGGLTWAYTSVGTGITHSSVWFVDAQRGWTLDIAGRIYQSTDGGVSWTLQHHAQAYLSTLQFFDAQHGWAIGGDTFLQTFDGGQTWSPAAVPPGTWSHGARFSDPLHGISVGEAGNVTRTTDGGQTWTTVLPMGSGPYLWDVESLNSASSAYSGDAGALAMTRNGGARWRSIQSGGTGMAHGIDAVDPLHAWVGSDHGEVLRTANGGQHWLRVAVPGFDQYGYIQDIDFLDPSLGWAVGRHEFFGAGTGRIVRSTDGGAHWQIQHSVEAAYMESVEALGPQTVIAIGNVPSGPRFVLRTSDGGSSWQDVAPSQALVMDSDFVDASTGWIVGGRIHKSTDGGQTWVQQYVSNEVLYSVSFADPLHGWAVGWGPTILRTTDGGLSWMPQSAGTPTSVYFAVQAVGPDVAWIAGGSGFIARTTDGGATWQPETVPGTSGWFEAVRFLDASSGWAGGSGIWRRQVTGFR